MAEPTPPFTDDELAAALRVLAAVAGDRSALSHVDRDARVRLQQLAGEIARPDLKERKRLQRALAKRERDEKRAHDEALRMNTGIRALRARATFETPPPLDAASPPSSLSSSSSSSLGFVPPPVLVSGGGVAVETAAVTAGGDARPTADPRVTRLSGDANHARATSASSGPGDASDEPRLNEARKCYVCKQPYTTVHGFYDQLCTACGDVNYARRTARADLRGRVALVTGARVKIGYQAAILLLRAGCTVVACTRFPQDAARRYARESDFDVWCDRLHVHGIDLRHTPSVDALCRHLDVSLPRLDFQIHNACQTVRRPPGFYGHLLDGERDADDLAVSASRVLDGHRALAAQRPALASAPLLTQATRAGEVPDPRDGAALALFPAGALDADLQQVDLRTHNSWRTTLADVPSIELLEVLLVNAAAPFVMARALLPLMRRARDAPAGTATSSDTAKHIVMVSAMEGQFYREHKTDKHPHTNMAKAALNMLVRTSAADLVRERIFMNAVDTGWVTDEDPHHLAAKKAEEHRFSPPLDIVDGAARIVDPIVEGFRSGRHAWGVFFKDYAPTPW